jgi:uncharacterized protein YndB with AHSA1/START domain
MKIALILLGTTLVCALLIVLRGRSMPREHEASVTVQLAAPPERVMAMLLDHASMTTWRKDLKSIRLVNDVVEEVNKHGALQYRVHARSPLLLETEIIADPLTADFGGTWQFTLQPKDQGTELNITERGFVNPAWMRVASKYVFGHDTNIRSYATDLQKHLR